MPSKNRLLGSGVPEQESVIKHIEPTHLRTPVWRFHRDFPDKLCKTDIELDKLDNEGWLDHPGKARLLPGHEKVWEAYKKSLEVSKVDEIKEEVVIEVIKSEDQIMADILKAESDKVEAKRLEIERKEEEKRLKDKQREEEKRVKAEQNVTYEEAKIPPGPRLCTLCGLTFASLAGLNMHGMRMHRRRIVKKSDLKHELKGKIKDELEGYNL